jgi:ATP-dependent DNA helicase RecG
MSATPIPRTLALILYGDLDISVIRKIPSGRIPVETYTALPAESDRVYDIVRRQVEAGRQAYFVCPVIESTAEEFPEPDAEADFGPDGLISAEDLFAHLSEDVFGDLSVGLLHGGMKATEKEDVMIRFLPAKSGFSCRRPLLRSVSIIRTLPLWSLRTRTATAFHSCTSCGAYRRGKYRSVCILLSDKTEGLAAKRMKALCRTSDGFEIARQDLELRGPGDFFGTRQHGIPELRIANLYRIQVFSRKSAGLWTEYGRRIRSSLPKRTGT